MTKIEKIRKKIGQIIRKKRREKDLTQNELAKRCNTTMNTIVRVEKGIHSTSIDTIIKIKQELDINDLFI